MNRGSPGLPDFSTVIGNESSLDNFKFRIKNSLILDEYLTYTYGLLIISKVNKGVKILCLRGEKSKII